MIVNGVTLPDIPEYILNQNPFVLVVRMLTPEGNMTMLLTSTAAFTAVPPGMTVDEQAHEFYHVASTVTDNFMFMLVDGSEEWMEGGRSSSLTFPVDITQEGTTVELLYTNHDIYVASAFDDTTNLATAGTQIYRTATQLETPPTRYSIAKAILDAVARQIMRLTDSTEKVKPEEFEAKLASVPKSGELPEGILGICVGKATTIPTLNNSVIVTSATKTDSV